MITLVAQWRVKENELETVEDLLEKLATQVRDEPGNLCFDIYLKQDDPERILLFEQYVDPAALEAHRKTSHFLDLVLEKIVPRLESRILNVFET